MRNFATTAYLEIKPHVPLGTYSVDKQLLNVSAYLVTCAYNKKNCNLTSQKVNTIKNALLKK